MTLKRPETVTDGIYNVSILPTLQLAGLQDYRKDLHVNTVKLLEVIKPRVTNLRDLFRFEPRENPGPETYVVCARKRD